MWYDWRWRRLSVARSGFVVERVGLLVVCPDDHHQEFVRANQSQRRPRADQGTYRAMA